MGLEALANELLLDLFEYLNSASLLRAFYGLNDRLNGLLIVYFRDHYLDFKSMSKCDFDLVCRDYLLLIGDHIRSVRLSDDDDTPQQIDRFRSYGLKLCHFTRLQTLSLYNVNFELTTNQMIKEWHQLPFLKYLYFLACSMQCFTGYGEEEIRPFFNGIWSLPKLNVCYFDIYLVDRDSFVAPTIISSTIEYLDLAIDNFFCPWDEAIRLFQNTPCLRYLRGSFDDDIHGQALPVLLSLTESHIALITRSSWETTKFLQSMPNLCRLTIDLEIHIIDGYQWEQIITNNLTKLKVFRFRMADSGSDLPWISEQGMNKLVDSFRSPFWMIDHRWFVQCRTNLVSNVCVYTLPYAFSTCRFDTKLISKPTSPNASYQWSFNRVRRLFLPYNSEDTLLSDIQFFNAHHLYTRFPFYEGFSFIVPKFDRLISLDIHLLRLCEESDAQSQLQNVLDRAPHLYSLKISSVSHFLSLSNLRSTSIRRLVLDSLTDEECAQLSCSLLGVQCEVLRIRVNNWISIYKLLETMTNLRALSFYSNDDTWKMATDPLVRHNDELVQRLQHQLPSSYTITRELYNTFCNPNCYIQIWIR
jgi:hypothetical protein